MMLRTTLLLGLTSGLLLAVAYRVPGAWPLSFVALVPLLFVVVRARRARDAFYAGTVAGSIIMGTGMSWFFDALPLPDAFGVSPTVAGLAFVLISWSTISVVCGACMGVWALVSRPLRNIFFLDVLALAVLFVAFEYARMIAFGFLSFDFGTDNPLFFSAGFIGYPLADSASWLQVASFGGVAALSFVVVIVNLLFFIALRARRTVFVAVLIGVLIGVSFAPIISVREHIAPAPQKEVRVAGLSLYSPLQGVVGDYTPIESEVIALMRDAAREGAELIVLPEDSHFLRPSTSLSVSNVIGTSTATVIDSGAFVLPNGERPFRAFAHQGSSITAIQDKRILTPQGEYLSFFFKLILYAVGAREESEAFLAVRDFTNAKDSGAPIELQSSRASLLFCLEVMKPHLAARVVREQESDFLVVTASHSWFEHSRSLGHDILRFTRVQAVEAGVPVVSAANFRPAYVLDRYGRIVVRAGENGEPDIAITTLPLP